MPIIVTPAGYSSPTLDELAYEVTDIFHGYSLNRDAITYLTADCTATDTTLNVEQGQGVTVGRGLIEVGDELIRIASVDSSNGQVTSLPRGRGWRGTTAAAHTSGDTVIVNPAVPSFRVKTAIQETIQALYPALYAIGTTEFTYSTMVSKGWEIPAEALAVLDVQFQDYLGNWDRVEGWSVDRSANTTSFPSGVALNITEYLPVGRTVRVIYGKRPATLVTGSTQFTDSGLEPSAKDLVVWGSVVRLAPAIDVGRLGSQSVAADEMDSQRSIGTAVNVARDYQKKFDDRLKAEQQDQKSRYPARWHRVEC